MRRTAPATGEDNKEDSVVRPMTTPKPKLVTQLTCLCCRLFWSMVEPSVRSELSDQPIPFPCGGAMDVPIPQPFDVAVNLLVQHRLRI